MSSMRATRASILVVDDDKPVAEALASLLEQVSYSVEVAGTGTNALELLRGGGYDAVVSDIRMPPPDGLELVRLAQDEWPDVPVLLVTAFATVPLAVEAMKRGAADFIMKPFDREQLLTAVDNALAARSALRLVPPETLSGYDLGIVGESEAARRLRHDVARVAQSDMTVLIRGETGTGKGLVARTIHTSGPRKDRSFIRLQLSGVSDAVMDAQLYGDRGGTAPGSAPRHPGSLNLADGGTLFLDELGDASASMQALLLRLLDEPAKGGSHLRSGCPMGVRFVAATQRNLEAQMQAGQWREDLHYRLNVAPLVLPPLRERGNDAVLIALAVCSRLEACQTRRVALDRGAIAALSRYDWPGNVRQLINVVERAALFSDDGSIRARDLEREFEHCRHSTPSASYAERRLLLEREELAEVLARAKGNRSRAARLLGISRRTLYSRLKGVGM